MLAVFAFIGAVMLSRKDGRWARRVFCKNSQT